jgi:hypothetical protein
MNQPDFFCSSVQAWLQALPAQNDPGVIDPPLLAHVRGCARCRGTFYAMFAPAVVPAHSPPISCEECQDGLAAFVHVEFANPIRAIRLYPQVWQHLWLCAECLEAYDILVAVLRDEPELRDPEPWPLRRPPGSPPAPPARFKPLLEMRRPALVGLPTRAELAGAYRSDTVEREYLLRRNQAFSIAGLSGTVKALRENAETWAIEVALLPPIKGRIRATVGDYQQTARIDYTGVACFTAIPTNELISDTTSLILELEANEY